ASVLAKDGLDLVVLVNKYAPLAPKIFSGTLSEEDARAAIAQGVSDVIEQILENKFRWAPRFVIEEANKFVTPIIIDRVLRAVLSRVGTTNPGAIQIRGPQSNSGGTSSKKK